ncbi:hypothetical protein ANN_01561 [Periplaneta americana]|uniref:Uncharacterized protein n=1 Tax=Periplaneta americana TaxID=6978 RepID=A0ABQ8TXA6_PERAM|nr:hypothetical protein ANN_01561 [Periplaneta americana]
MAGLCEGGNEPSGSLKAICANKLVLYARQARTAQPQLPMNEAVNGTAHDTYVILYSRSCSMHCISAVQRNFDCILCVWLYAAYLRRIAYECIPSLQWKPEEGKEIKEDIREQDEDKEDKGST